MKVLVVKTSSMGDVIHTFPAIEDALRHVPGIAFDWCVEEAFRDIVALHPAVRAIHKVAIRRWRKSLLAGDSWREVSQLRERLRSEHYDLVIDAQGLLLKSAVVARLADAPVAGFGWASAREPLSALLYNRRYRVPRDLHAIERTRRLFGQALGYASDFSTLDSGIQAPALASGFAAKRTAILLHGTSREDKKWATGNWIETARLAAARGLTPVTTFSNDSEQKVAEEIAAAVPETLLVAKSSLRDIAAVIGNSELVIGADTGLTHLASAFGVPTVAIFLATEPGLTGPRGAFSSTLIASDAGPVTPASAIAEADRLLAERLAGGS